MDVLITYVIFFSLAGLFVFAAAVGLMYKILLYRDEYKALQAKISLLERENLELARRNKALRELLR